jgi:autotransporter-associated beta strand protein
MAMAFYSEEGRIPFESCFIRQGKLKSLRSFKIAVFSLAFLGRQFTILPMRIPLRFIFLLAIFFANVSSSFAQADLASLRGNYFALIQGDSYDTSGYLKMTVTAKGIATCQIKLGNGKKCALTIGVGPGQGGQGGPIWSPITIIRIGDPDMSLDGHFIITSSQPPQFTGTVGDEGVTVPVTVVQQKDAADLAGSYTLLLSDTQSELEAVGTLKISAKGAARVALKLRDGKSLAVGANLSGDGTLPLLIQDNAKWTLSGNATFANESDSDLSATIVLQQPDLPAVQYTLIGSAYAKKTPVLDAVNAKDNVTLSLAVPGIELPVSTLGALAGSNKFTFNGNGLFRADASLVASNGVVNGKLMTAGSGKWTGFNGVVFQKQNLVTGFVRTFDGTFTIMPADQPNPDDSGSTQTGGSTLTITGSPGGYSGVTNINGGTLSFGNTGWDGGGATLTLSGGTLGTGDGGVITGSGLTFTNGGTLTVGGGTLGTGGGVITIATGSGLGSIINSGTGLNLTTIGTGTIVLAGSNTYTGTTTVSGGTLTVNPPLGTGTLNTIGATLNLGGFYGATLTLGGNSGGTPVITNGSASSLIFSSTIPPANITIPPGATLSVTLPASVSSSSFIFEPQATLVVHALSAGQNVTVTFTNSGQTPATLTNLQSAVDAAVASGQTNVDLAVVETLEGS